MFSEKAVIPLYNTYQQVYMNYPHKTYVLREDRTEILLNVFFCEYPAFA